jgi:beta-glucosidase/6-phospho-beta-glucosidase/beta-galactosidase
MPANLAARFAPVFLWGAATAAYQIEGAWNHEGKGKSIWDSFSHTPGRVSNGDTGDVACDHYHRYREDVALMAELGLDAYRFSVSWPRILPEGVGPVESRGLDFYERLVDELLAHEIRPFLTLYHWDLPDALQQRGGWTADDVPAWFAEYASVVADRLGDRVTDWATLNEPEVVAYLGQASGEHLEELVPGADFVGVNYYFREIVGRDGFVSLEGVKRTDMGWEVHPGGLTEVLLRVHEEYGAPVVYVTENGAAYPGIDDPDRIRYLESHVAAAADAAEDGVPLAGYFVWSLLDNFEWAYRFSKRFGVVHVDHETQERTIKTSGRWYQDLLGSRR